MNLRKILSPAKINLALQVLSKRFDGYHNINTIFFKIPFLDELIFQESIKTEIICNPDFNVPMEDNLIFKAIELIKRKFKINKNVRIILNKRIPTGGGLGGGSSNAASTLQFLNQYWNLNLDKRNLIEIGLELGSDVPFFLFGHNAAVGKGRGEILAALKLNLDCYLLLLTTNIHISTKEAYSGLKLKEGIEEKDFSLMLKEGFHFKEIFFNDFEETIFQKYPILGEIKKMFYDNMAEYAGMSGSGSTMFGLFREFSNIETAISSLDILIKKNDGLSLNTYTFQV
jgi:4-diphosphocytidyl-2-C-methyl-D-erythritol kinase